MKKKIISGALALALVLGGGAVLPEGIINEGSVISASANDSFVYDIFNVRPTGDGGFEIYSFTGAAPNEVVLPSEINGVSEIELSSDFLIDLKYNQNIRKISVRGNKTFSRHLDIYYAKDGILYSKSYNGATGTYRDRVFIVPGGMSAVDISSDVTDLMSRTGSPAIAGLYNVMYITLPSSLTSLGSYSLYNMKYLTRVCFPKDSKITLKQLNESKLGYCLNDSENTTFKNTSFVIECYKGSAAEQYAKKNGFRCWVVDADARADTNGKIDINDISVTIPKNKYVCTGKEVKPAVVVMNGNEALQEDVDYTVEYSGNSYVGKASVTVTGMGSYTGSCVLNFDLIPANVTGFNAFAYSKSAIELRWNAVANAEGYIIYIYDDAAQTYKRAAIIKNGNATQHFFWALKSGTTYKYAIKAFGIAGSNKEVVSAKFPTATVSTKPETVDFKLTSAKKTVKVAWSKVQGAKGYIVYYKTSKNGKWVKLTTTKGTSFKKTGLKRNTKYFFTVKAYRKVDGVQYNGGFKTKSIKTK